MGDLNDIALVDGTDYPLAEYLNMLFAGLMRSEYSNTQTISGTLELDDGDYWLQVISPSGAHRTVELSAEGDGNHITVIYNAGATYNVVVKDDSGATTFVTLSPDDWAMFVPVSGEGWKLAVRSDIPSGQSVLGSTFSITGTAGTFQDTGLSVDLPEEGTYLIVADARISLQGNAGTAWWIAVELYNSTDAAVVANSERMIGYTNSNTVILQQTSVLSMLVTVATAKTIKLYAARNGAGSPSWTTSVISSDANGRTSLLYRKIS